MATQGAFRQLFHESDAPGPEDPRHWMYRTHASNSAIGGLALYRLVMLGLVVWVILDEFRSFLWPRAGFRPWVPHLPRSS